MGLYQGNSPLSYGNGPVAYAKEAGYTGTDTDFYNALADMPDHISDSENPHGTTASQVGAYTKEETNTLLQNKADLDENGKVPSTQLPNMDYIPTSEKGANSGVATLGSDGKVPTSQLPSMDYAPSTHASQHASGGSDPITPASIGAATSDHSHSNYASSSHNHAASEITSGTLSVARGGTGKSSVTSGNFLVGNGTSALTEKTPAQVLSAIGAAASSHTHSNYAASSHNHAASNITSGTLAVARGGTGVTSNPSMLTNLASTSAASVFAASPRPGVTGILPVANGGTGTNSLATLASNMGASKIQTGSYTGTGAYGYSNPCSLTFNFVPKLVQIDNFYTLNDYQYYSFGIIGKFSGITSIQRGNGSVCFGILISEINSKTIKWYSGRYIEARNSGVDCSIADGLSQLNEGNSKYYWYCFG